MRPLPIAAALLALAAATPALAQSELDRLETYTEAAGANMEAFMTGLAPELAPVMPDLTWDDEMRGAAACTLDAIRAQGGDAAVTTYLDAIEVFSRTDITSLEQMGAITPVPIGPEAAMQIAQTCGTAEIALRRMTESGFMAAMMSPDIMTRFMDQ